MFVLSDPAHQTLNDRQARAHLQELFCPVCGGPGMAIQAIRLATTSPQGMILNGYLTSLTNLCIPGYSGGPLPIINFVINTSVNSVKWHLTFLFFFFFTMG